MTYIYHGIDEFEDCILKTDIPIDEGGFGTSVKLKLYQPERLSEKTREGSDSPNNANI